MLVSEPRVWKLHGSRVLAGLRRAGLECGMHLLPRGERAKTWSAVSRLMSRMLRQGLGRDGAVLALGGGSVTDAAGFAAAIYMRGINWVSLPTTLLGQVDAGIGGKTGIDLAQGKNLAGAFHPPLITACDTALLETLSPRDFNCGLAEAVKFALVCDPGLWAFIRKNWTQLLLAQPAATETLVRRAAAGKLRLTTRDPQETKGLRDFLNFGHTIGHALELAAGLGPLRHGEAVVCGMRAALRLSQAHAGLAAGASDEIDAFLRLLPVPRLAPRPNSVLAALNLDKKTRAGRGRFVLLRSIGRPVIKSGLPQRSVRRAIQSSLQELRA